jgi:hypothetical protein
VLQATPKKLQTLLNSLLNCSESTLCQELAAFKKPKNKEDLVHWNAVLERFESILDRAYKAFERTTFCDPFHSASATAATTTASSSSSPLSSSTTLSSSSSPDDELVAQILRVTLLILQSSTGRSNYRSIEVLFSNHKTSSCYLHHALLLLQLLLSPQLPIVALHH